MLFRSSGRPDLADRLVIVPEIAAAFGLAMGIGFSETAIAAGFAATVTLFLIWIGRELAAPQIKRLLMAPVIWLGIAMMGALGAWWGGAIVPSVAALAAILLYLRASRRITRF